jgi:hypothetical protein
VFPDPNLKWLPYPSQIDGIQRLPYVLDKGMWKGILHLVILEGQGARAYGIRFDCEMYFGIDEMIYSIAAHGTGAMYDGGIYIKETMNSAWLKAYTAIEPLERVPRHFLFVGNDYCYECVGFNEPIIHTFATEDEAYAWGPDQTV